MGFCLFRLELQRDGVDAIALSRGLAWAIIEEVSQVSAAVLTDDLCALHEKGTVLVQFNMLFIHGLVEARPPCA